MRDLIRPLMGWLGNGNVERMQVDGRSKAVPCPRSVMPGNPRHIAPASARLFASITSTSRTLAQVRKGSNTP